MSVYQGGYNFFCQNTHSGGDADNRVKQQTEFCIEWDMKILSLSVTLLSQSPEKTQYSLLGSYISVLLTRLLWQFSRKYSEDTNNTAKTTFMAEVALDFYYRIFVIYVMKWFLACVFAVLRWWMCCGGITSPSSSSSWTPSSSSWGKTTTRSRSCTCIITPPCSTSGGSSWTGCRVDTVSLKELMVQFICWIIQTWKKQTQTEQREEKHAGPDDL